MPGYGYARAPKEQVSNWTRLVFDFLRGRPNLRRVYVLVDARHGLKESDGEALKVLDKAAVSYHVVLTKADKVRPADLPQIRAEVLSAARKHPAAHPQVFVTSAEAGAGLPELRAEIASLWRIKR
jgi:GTP-binding protein